MQGGATGHGRAYEMARRMEIPPYVGRTCSGKRWLISPPPPLHRAHPLLCAHEQRTNFMYISDNEIKTLFLPHCKRPLVNTPPGQLWPSVARLGLQRHHDPQRHIIIFFARPPPLCSDPPFHLGSHPPPRLHIEAKNLLCLFASLSVQQSLSVSNGPRNGSGSTRRVS